MIHKRTKNIKSTLIWLISLMIFSHVVIPHHHHFDSLLEHNKTKQSNQHSEESASHCHAFNILIIDNTKASSQNISIYKNNFTAVTDRDISYQPIRIERSTNIVENKNTHPDEVFHENFPTRGSPSNI